MPLLKRKLGHARRLELMPAGSLPMAGVRAARPLRIALVTEYYYPHLGGICEHVHFFAREARRHGHQVDIITSNMPGTRYEPHVIRIGKSQPIYANGSQARFTWGGEIRRALKGSEARVQPGPVRHHPRSLATQSRSSRAGD